MDDDVVALEAADLVEVVIGVQIGMPEVVVEAPVEVVGARPRDERDLDRAERGLIGRRRRAGDQTNLSDAPETLDKDGPRG